MTASLSLLHIVKVLPLVCVIQCLQWSGAQPQDYSHESQPQTSDARSRTRQTHHHIATGPAWLTRLTRRGRRPAPEASPAPPAPPALIEVPTAMTWTDMSFFVLVFCFAIAVYAWKEKASVRLKYTQEEDKGEEEDALPHVTIFECIGLVQKFDEYNNSFHEQLRQLAITNKSIVQGDLDERIERLKKLLVSRLDEDAIGQEYALALKVFVVGKEGSPSASIESMMKLYLLALMVAVFQTFGLGLMVYSARKDLQSCQVSLTNFTAVLVVNMFIFNYYSQARTSATGSCKVAADAHWTLLTDLIFLMSTIFALAAANIVIWTQSEVVAIVAYSMMVLCVYYLGEIAMKLFVISPEQFGRWAIRNYKLLKKCPEFLQDLTSTGATSESDIWKIKTEKAYKAIEISNEASILKPVIELFGWVLYAAFLLPWVGVFLLAQNS